MKKLFVSLIIMFAMSLFTMSAFADKPEPVIIAKFVNPMIEVGPGKTEEVLIPLEGDKLESIKLCLSFDGPKKNVEVKGIIPDTWFGSVSTDCTPLDQVGGVLLPEEHVLKLSCRNFESVKRICRVKAVIYTSSYD